MSKNNGSVPSGVQSASTTNGDEFEEVNITDAEPAWEAQSTRTTSDDDFEEINHTDTEPATVKDLRNIHAIHVTGTHSHILPPYAIIGETKDLLTTTWHPDTPEGKAKRASDEAWYAEQERNYASQNPYFPVGGYVDTTMPPPPDRRELHVVHKDGKTMELWIPMGDRCDHTCPQARETTSDKLMRNAGNYKKQLGGWDTKTLF